LEVDTGQPPYQIIEVSIPLWDDWKHLLVNANHKTAKVSIPLWDDWKEKGNKEALTELKVSIPLWDDWKRTNYVLTK